MLLFAYQITPRLQYIVDFISNEFFTEPITITTNVEEFKQHNGAKINYSQESFSEQEFFIKNSPLLFETGIRPQVIETIDVNFQKAFFQTGGDFVFDVLAASFYLLTRYEEYLPHEKDEYGRYAHSNSIAFKEGFLHLPLVNCWLQDLKKALQNKFPDLYFTYRSFRFRPTYDIDIAYSYNNKGWTRNLGGLVRSAVKGQWHYVNERIQVLQGKQKDPFDSYEWLDALHLYCRQKAYYFFLVAREPKGFDKNIDPSSESLQKLIQYHASGYKVGVHPSWQSGDDKRLLKEEIEFIEYVTDKKVIHSRQHYIRMTIPETYRILIDAGIQKDFSMGYGSINGFRASVASSFQWYDLENEKTTGLRLYPFSFMDANAYYEQKLTPQQAFEEMMRHYRIIKKVNGLMMTIWHNNFLGTDPAFKGWREVYEVFLKDEVYWDQ